MHIRSTYACRIWRVLTRDDLAVLEMLVRVNVTRPEQGKAESQYEQSDVYMLQLDTPDEG